jgi:Fic family protein
MEFARKKMFGKPLSLETIVEAHTILMPDLVSEVSVIGLDDDDDDSPVFRKVPIHVRGSPVVRPYGHEVPAVMEKLLRLHDQQRRLHHPLVCNSLLFMNFLMIHPFADGNGRLARLLLFVLQHNAGYFGLMFQVKDRTAFFQLFTPYYIGNDLTPILEFITRNNAELLDKLAEYEQTCVVPSF